MNELCGQSAKEVYLGKLRHEVFRWETLREKRAKGGGREKEMLRGDHFCALKGL